MGALGRECCHAIYCASSGANTLECETSWASRRRQVPPSHATVSRHRRRALRALAPHRAFVSRLRRDSLMLMACDLASEAYRPITTDTDIFLVSVFEDVEVAVGRRWCRGHVYVTVAFCGSEGFGDWLHNLMVWTVRPFGSPGRVHAGFQRRWAAISSKLTAAIRRLEPRRLLITGHSLGGAVATIAAPVLARSFPKASVSVVTFGAPQVGDSRFNECARPKNVVSFVRCVHIGDIVQLFPPFPWFAHPSQASVLVVGGDAEFARRRAGAGVDAFDCWGHVLLHQLLRIWRRKFRLCHHQIFEYKRALILAEASGNVPIAISEGSRAGQRR